jgi:hypothetical protein
MWRWAAIPAVGIFGYELGGIFGGALGYIVPAEPLPFPFYSFVQGALVVLCAALPAVAVAPAAKPLTAAIVSAGVIALHFGSWPPHLIPIADVSVAGALTAGIVATAAALRRCRPWWVGAFYALEHRVAIRSAWYREVETAPGRTVIWISSSASILAVVLVGGTQLVDLLIAITHMDPDTVDEGLRVQMFFWMSMGANMAVLGFRAWIVSLVGLIAIALRHRHLLATRVGTFCIASVALVLFDYCVLGGWSLVRSLVTAPFLLQ